MPRPEIGDLVRLGGWVTMAPAAPAATTPIPPARPERDDSLELLLRSLSERERQVLALLGRGHANRRIAEICNLSLNTVRTHVQNVLVKLGVHSKLEAATIAVRHGLVHGWATIASLASPDVVEPPFGQLRFLRRYSTAVRHTCSPAESGPRPYVVVLGSRYGCSARGPPSASAVTS